MLPKIDAPVFHTPNGVPYLRGPGAIMIARPMVDLSGMKEFLDGFDPALSFGLYLDDPVELPPAEALSKVAGQLCYLSFGPARSMNERASEYLERIKESKHGSVFQHATFSFILYGVTRTVTHDLVRHQAGTGYSQASQRYVDGTRLRFVEATPFQRIPELHDRFIRRIEFLHREYHELGEILTIHQAQGIPILAGATKTDRRKKVQETARECLPNETEAPICVSGNVRAWRHICEMRASEHADIKIRAAIMNVFRCLRKEAPMLFEDYEVVTLPDGTEAVRTPYLKV